MAPVPVLTGHSGPLHPHAMRLVPAIVAMSIPCFSSMCWLIYSSAARNIMVHHITHKQQLYDISIVLVAFLGAAQRITTPTFVSSSSAPFAGLCLRASCSLSDHCLRNPIFFISFLFPANSSRSVALKPMGVKADGCQRPRPLVDTSDSDSDPDSRPLTPCGCINLSPLSHNSLGGVSPIAMGVIINREGRKSEIVRTSNFPNPRQKQKK